MTHFNQITNDNRDIQDKVNYFIDRFLHMNSFAGLDYRLEIENHLSLIEKIHFNLTHGTKPSSDIHETYFKHGLLEDNEFWQPYPTFQKTKNYFDKYLSGNKKQREAIATDTEFIQVVQSLRDELYQKEREFIYHAMWSHMRCPYPLYEHEHIEKIDIVSKWMVSEAYFSGMTYTDLNEAIRRIFKKDNTGLFPFPPEVRTKVQKKKFLAAGVLDNQLSGFKRTMERNNQQYLFLMKIFGNAIFPTDIDFSYDGVSILGSEHPRIQKLRQTTAAKDYFQQYLAPGDHSFILVEISYFSIDSIRELIYRHSQKQLDYFSAICRCQLELDPNGGFISLSKRGKIQAFNLPLRPERKKLTQDVIEDLKNNPHQNLAKLSESPSQQWFLQHESLFVEAHRSSSISAYWKYLEALLPSNGKTGRQIKSTVSQLLVLNETFSIKQRIIGTLYSTLDFFSGGDQLFGIPWDELPKARKQLQKDRIPKQIQNSDYPFVKELLKELRDTDSVQHRQKSVAYYKNILIETYSIRNHEFHGGHAHPSAIIKLRCTLPRLIQRLRWVLMDGIKANPHYNFPQLIESLSETADDLLGKKTF